MGVGSETILCDATVVDTCDYILVQTHRMYNTHTHTQNPNVKYRLLNNNVSILAHQS